MKKSDIRIFIERCVYNFGRFSFEAQFYSHKSYHCGRLVENPRWQEINYVLADLDPTIFQRFRK